MLEDISPLLDFFLYRPTRPEFDRQFCSGEWGEVIDHLMAAGYAFKKEQFNVDGFLFRGMDCGLEVALQQQQFGHLSGLADMSRAEQIMQIYFVTHELSDAVTAARLFEIRQDNAVLVFKASLFNYALNLKEAAILEIGDMRVIFRYPFLTAPLTANDLDCIIVKETARHQVQTLCPSLVEKLLVVQEGSRDQIQKFIVEELEKREITAAVPEPSAIIPRLRDYD